MLVNIGPLALKLIEINRERAAGLEQLRCCEVTAIIQQREVEQEHAEWIKRAELEARAKALGQMHGDTLSLQSELVAILQMRGKLEEAESMQRHIVNALENSPGARHPATVRARADLTRIQKMRKGRRDHKKAGRHGLAL